VVHPTLHVCPLRPPLFQPDHRRLEVRLSAKSELKVSVVVQAQSVEQKD
jgi:hypothetical protein